MKKTFNVIMFAENYWLWWFSVDKIWYLSAISKLSLWLLQQSFLTFNVTKLIDQIWLQNDGSWLVLWSSVIVIIRLLLSLLTWPKVITISGAYCSWPTLNKNNVATTVLILIVDLCQTKLMLNFRFLSDSKKAFFATFFLQMCQDKQTFEKLSW